MPQQPGMALAGIRVVDLSSLLAGPLIATNLGDFGAEVIKVEHPSGDPARDWGLRKDGIPLWWKTISRNKDLITLDLNRPAQRQQLRRLVRSADVVIENFRPGRLESWGLGYHVLSANNPGLILVRVSGFGQTGPRSREPGFGTLAEAFSGFAYMTGEPGAPPTLPPFGLADGVAAQFGTFASLIALYWRDTQPSGTGQVIDLSLYEPLFSILGPQITEFMELGVVQGRIGNRSPRTSPRNLYRTADDQWVAISAGTQQIAQRIFEAIGRPDIGRDSEMGDQAGRRRHANAIDAIVAEWMQRHTLEEIQREFERAQAPLAPVNSVAQIANDKHYLERQSFISVPDPDLGQVTMANIVPRLSLTPGSIRHPGRAGIGTDTSAVAQREVKVKPQRMGMTRWDDLLTGSEMRGATRAGFGQMVTLGSRPALLIIDLQNYMVGPPEGSTNLYPSACGRPAREAIQRLRPIISAARRSAVPVIYTRFELKRDGSDVGIYRQKRQFLSIEGWCLEGSEGAQIAAAVYPEPADIVIVKKRPSAFFNTTLAQLLDEREVDSLLLAGGSTSNCVRATAVDAAARDYPVGVIEDCVFDRIEISHRVALMDLDRQYANVMSADAILEYIGALSARESEELNA